MKNNIIKTLIFLLIVMIGCKNQEKKKNNQSSDNNISLSKLKGSPIYDKASLFIDENNLKIKLC